MKITQIEYEQLYPTGVYANQRYRAVATIEAHEDLIECYGKLKDGVEKVFVALNPQIKWHEQEHLHQPLPEINKEAERVEIAIDNSKSLEELNVFLNDSMKYDLVKQFLEKKKSFQ